MKKENSKSQKRSKLFTTSTGSIESISIRQKIKVSKTSPQKQFSKIKEALKEVEKIETGIIKPQSLDDLLNEI